ncbi:MAG: ATP-binding protein [Flavobacterium sp.]|nr:ATP-binding protein [Flavobacterium sp.]
MEREATEGMIFAVIGLVGLCAIVVFLFIVFQKKKNALLLHQIEAEKHFEQEIAESQIEIREQTLRNISWELHDNIGQLLTLAKIQLQSVVEHPENIHEVTQTLGKSLTEIRALSKIINPDFISNVKLLEAIQLETDRFNRLNYISASLSIKGIPQDLDAKSEIVIFRILQEFFANTIKHSKATELDVSLNYAPEKLIIITRDNGIGFSAGQKTKNGIGLSNMKKRGNLINAEINIESGINKGTTLTIVHICKP